MWKVSLAFIFHRLILIGVGYVCISQSLVPKEKRGFLAPLQSAEVVWQNFDLRISQGSESKELERLFNLPPQDLVEDITRPFSWMHRIISRFSKMGFVPSAILLSNLILICFLSELHALLRRMVLQEVATLATIFVIFLPTSYELSLVSSFTLNCLLTTMVVRHALDNRWLIVGLALACLGLIEPMVWLMFPLLLFLFWYFQRHYFFATVVKRTLFFILPVVGVLIWRWDGLRGFYASFVGSAGASLVSSILNGMSVGWLVSKHFAGQSLMLLLLILGALSAFLTNLSMVHRIIPLYMLVVLFLSSPYAELSSRSALAATCLQGVAMVSARPIAKILLLVLLIMSGTEVISLFR